MNYDDLLTQEAHEEGAEVNILHPNTGKPTDVWIKVLGVDSREWQRAYKKVVRGMLEGSRKGDEIDEDVELLLAVTVGWRGMMREGKELAFSKKECRNLYAKSPRVMQQVNRFIGDHKNFIKG